MNQLTHQEYLQLVVEVNRLRDEINLFNQEEIPESALDDLKHKISLYESEFPDKISVNSPNYTISGGVAKGFTKFDHKRRMLSLNDIFSLEELQDWEQRWKNYLINQEGKAIEDLNIKYICEPKLDGLAMSLHYQGGELIAAATRGDGWVGELVTENIKQIRAIPKEIPDKRAIEIRGEVFLTKKDFQELNEAIMRGEKIGKMGKTGQEGLFANPRNASSGTIRQLDSRVVAQRNLSFVAYGVFIDEDI